jgi:hypothetical protein
MEYSSEGKYFNREEVKLVVCWIKLHNEKLRYLHSPNLFRHLNLDVELDMLWGEGKIANRHFNIFWKAAS